MTNSANDSERQPVPKRAPYAAPRLQTFGTFAALTRTAGMMGILKDTDSTKGNTKTM